eukprot:2506092-Prorocentrum_lima.AAC.1
MRERYRSLLGALAWLLMSRADVAPFIGHLQRHAHKPQNTHVQVINRVLRFCKRVNTGMFYKKLVAPTRIVIVAGAAYKSNESIIECLAHRGYLVLLVGSQT